MAKKPLKFTPVPEAPTEGTQLEATPEQVSETELCQARAKIIIRK